MLFKYATDDITSADSKQNKLIAALLGAGGASLIYDSYRNGELTGRQTAWHFTKKENVPGILEKGILPGSSVPDKVGKTNILANNPNVDYKKALGVGYATPSNYIDAFISYGGDLSEADQPIFTQKSRLNYRGVKLNIPTWDRKIIINPEVANYKDADDYYLKNQGSIEISPKVEKFSKKRAYHALKDEIAIEDGIPASDVVGSPHYKRNSLKEITNYIKSNRRKFAKGVGKSAIGLGLLGGSGYLLTQEENNEGK